MDDGREGRGEGWATTSRYDNTETKQAEEHQWDENEGVRKGVEACSDICRYQGDKSRKRDSGVRRSKN